MKYWRRGFFVITGLAVITALFLAYVRMAQKPRYSSHPAIFTVHIRAEFMAARSDGKHPEYRSTSESWGRIIRSDSTGGSIRMSLEVDSISYSSSERDQAEWAFMNERLKKYQAHWRMTGDGHVLDMREEPELPRAELIFRLGPALAAALPIFSESPADTQSLFDPSEPGAVLIQGVMGKDARPCDLRWAGTGEGGMKGKMKFRMDKKTGFPARVELDVKGDLPASGDSGSVSAPAEMRYKYQFDVSQLPG